MRVRLNARIAQKWLRKNNDDYPSPSPTPGEYVVACLWLIATKQNKKKSIWSALMYVSLWTIFLWSDGQKPAWVCRTYKISNNIIFWPHKLGNGVQSSWCWSPRIVTHSCISAAAAAALSFVVSLSLSLLSSLSSYTLHMPPRLLLTLFLAYLARPPSSGKERAALVVVARCWISHRTRAAQVKRAALPRSQSRLYKRSGFFLLFLKLIKAIYRPACQVSH